MAKNILALVVGLMCALIALHWLQPFEPPPAPSKHQFPIVKSDEEWKKQLDPQQYNILRQKGTEFAGSGKYAKHHENGTYQCAGCGQSLFDSTAKFESGTGWPSFFQPLSRAAVYEESDRSHGMERIEVMCSQCGGHLGHVFRDGPQPTGLRYCMNSASLQFKAREGQP